MPTCPDEPTLRAFAVGDLAGDELERVASHLAGCGDCASALDGLDDQSDSLVEHLRGLARDAGPAAEAVPQALIRTARAALVLDGEGDGAPDGESEGSELVVDAGGRIARSLETGPVRLGRFELLEPLGAGTFGHVFRARDTELDRVVAVKVQRAIDPGGSDENDRFLREARSAAQLEHPGIVSLYDTGRTEDGASYLVTELVEGRTLEDRLREGRPTAREAADLVAQVARALQYAHAQGVIHRDVKPSNIMIDRESRPHVMDFGLAKREAGEVTVTVAGEVMGTPAYMSPEQACGDSHHVDARSDIFSLGVILYELLTAERPFQGNRRMLMLQLMEDDPRPPRRLDETVPRDLETICLKAMAKEPGRRYAGAGELADDLQRFMRGEPIQARRASLLHRLRHWCRGNPVAASLFVAVTLGPTTGMLYLSYLSHEFVEDTALSSAGMQAEMLEEMNTFYSEIVSQLDGRDVDVTHQYVGRAGAVPLPATFTIEAGRRISAGKSGMQVRLYSDYPFPWREDGGAQDDFEADALRRLRLDPDRPVHLFGEMDGRPVLRHATARIMRESCLGCHNTRPDSPKRDWQAGDVRGVLEIIRPLHKDVARVRSGLQGSFVVVAAVSVLLLALAVLALLLGGSRHRRRLQPG